MELKELEGKKAAKAAELMAIFDEHRVDKNDHSKGFKEMSAAVREDIQKRNEELDTLGRELKDAHELHTIAERTERELKELNAPANRLENGDGNRGGGDNGGRMVKSIGEIITEDARYKEALEKGLFGNTNIVIDLPSLDMKTFTTSDWEPPTTRSNVVVLSVQTQPVIQQYIPTTTVGDASTEYMEETVFTNNAENVSEGSAASSDSVITFTKRSIVYEDIEAHIAVSQRVLEDVPQTKATINDRLKLMHDQKVQTQIISGNGTSPQLKGFLQATGLQTQAKGSDDAASAFYKAMTKIMVNGDGNPSLTSMHPNDWQDIRLMKDGNGNFIWGNPSVAGPESLWGVPVVKCKAWTEGTGFVGDTNLFAHLFIRKGAQIIIGQVNNQMKTRELTIMIVSRMALVNYRGGAYCQVTGI